MTFLALPGWVAWMLVAASVAVAVAAFFIPPRRIAHVVPSLLVWQPLVETDGARSLWARLRRAISLVLTTVIAGAVALAIARPMAPTAGGKGRLLLILDSSWSMRARTASGQTRWERAVAMAHDVVAGAGGREVAVATTAEGIIEGPTQDLARLSRLLDRLEPSGAHESAWPHLADVAEAHFFTDGAIARITEPGVVTHSAFAPAPNVAVTAFAVDTKARPDQAEVYVAVANFAPVPQTVQLVVTRAATAIASRSIEVPAGESYRDVLAVPTSGDPRFRVHVTARENALDIDDDAVAWLWAAEPVRLGVVSGSTALATLLAKDPGVKVVTVPPAGYSTAVADVWVFDRWLPSSPPASPALIIAPPASAWAGKIAREERAPRWRTAGGGHALLQGVDATLLQVQKTAALDRPELRVVAASEAGTPLVSVEDSPRGRYVMLGFALEESNLAALPAFPVLMGNAIDWLGRPERGTRRTPGAVVLPAATTRVTSPTGQSVPLERFGDHVTATFPVPGVYLVEAAGARRVMTVGLDDPRRSNLQVSGVPPASVPAGRGSSGVPSWWRVAAWAALALTAIEWLTWLKRVTV